MIRNVDLVSYLPPIMAEFQEYRVTLEAENPEFVLVWNATDQVLQNEFIATADEYGISRFEQILNILPSKEDTLESRRSRVQTLSLIHISEPTRRTPISYAVFCLKKKKKITRKHEKKTQPNVVHLHNSPASLPT